MTQPPDPGSGKVPVPELFPVDDDHYQALIDEVNNNNLVIFLGEGASQPSAKRLSVRAA